MNRDIVWTTQFKRDYKTIKKRGYDLSLLNDVIGQLATGVPLPEKYKEHTLKGGYAGQKECHITPDWLLVYKIDNDCLVLTMTRTGIHSDLF